MTWRTVVAAAAMATAAPAVALGQSWTAAPLIDEVVAVHRDPGGDVRLYADSFTAQGRPAAFMVLGDAEHNGERWLKVRLPVRPNDSYGWVPAARVDLRPTPWRVVVDVSDRTLWLYAGTSVAMRTRVIVGKAQTPTPTGTFALWQALPGRPGSTAPYELHLTAHSNVLTSFMGGPGRVAIHGMRGALVAPLGSAVSNGCIRIPDAPLARLVRQLPPGAPIVIRA